MLRHLIVLVLLLLPVHTDNKGTTFLPRYSEYEVECLARTIYGEARGEPLQGRIAVGVTVLYRGERLGLDLCSVVSQHRQFHGYRAKGHNWFAARQAIHKYAILDKYYFFSTHPSKRATKIGRHYFKNKY